MISDSALCFIYTWTNCCAFATSPTAGHRERRGDKWEFGGLGERQNTTTGRRQQATADWQLATGNNADDDDDDVDGGHMRTGAAVDAANELLLDFQWHSKNGNNNNNDDIKCDMSRDLNWRCCRKCTLICQSLAKISLEPNAICPVCSTSEMRK